MHCPVKSLKASLLIAVVAVVCMSSGAIASVLVVANASEKPVRGFITDTWSVDGGAYDVADFTLGVGEVRSYTLDDNGHSLSVYGVYDLTGGRAASLLSSTAMFVPAARVTFGDSGAGLIARMDSEGASSSSGWYVKSNVAYPVASASTGGGGFEMLFFALGGFLALGVWRAFAP